MLSIEHALCYYLCLTSEISFPHYVLLFDFAVVCYLAMFHLEDLGLEQFSTIIKSLDSSKMYKVRRYTVHLSSQDEFYFSV